MRLALAALMAASLWLVLRAAVSGEPELLSAFPFGGQQGADFKTTIRGRSLDNVSSVWFDCDQLSATIVSVENDKSSASGSAGKKKKKNSSVGPPQLLTLAVKVAPGAGLGTHYLRVLTPRGISNALPLRVHAEPALSEDQGRHDTPELAQKISAYPVVINGKITASGEVDYYSFETQPGETLRFDALTSGSNLDPALTLYDRTGSWFRPDRLTEIAFNDEDISYPGLPVNAAITHKFPRQGRYFVRVNGFLGQSGPDYSYQLSIRRVSPNQAEADLMRPAHMPPPSADPTWEERSWKRELKRDRLKVLAARGGEPAAAPEMAVVRLDAPGHKAGGEPVAVTLPTLIEGAIEHPADIDRVKFRVKAGDRVALEVETVRKTLPQFNPYLRIVSATGDEAFGNVHSTVNTCGDLILKQVQPKTTYSFPRDGEFILEIRDITHLYGDEAFAYRVLLRQQIPHMGEIRMAEEQINLMAGEATKVSVDTDQEEGFDGQIALTVDGLPQGVRVIAGTELQPHVPPPYNPGKIERFQPESQKATLLFVTDPGAAPTAKPVEAKLIAQPVIKGKLGQPVLVKKILVTVVHPDLPGKKAIDANTPETR